MRSQARPVETDETHRPNRTSVESRRPTCKGAPWAHPPIPVRAAVCGNAAGARRRSGLLAIYLAFTHVSGDFAGFSNFTQAADDYRFYPAFQNAFKYVAVWVLMLVVFAVGLALLLFRRPPKVGATLRVIYFLPGAFAGAASVLVWLFMLDPG